MLMVNVGQMLGWLLKAN